ncbi:hypothetical protein F5984_11100 [Rudanella paleaurantiibacter]|uniref:Transcriptional regulator n=1 Tax=Rudanella paleaurantiibacter TaxID=2614655 RepID=A0A7J5U0R3_9BACT|nr:hypothetical protein [Rudanella paleaurantiibacter]KAB7731336.1 hypothetical protein F5984_11100 [Rudanella paleaurantiibacter]
MRFHSFCAALVSGGALLFGALSAAAQSVYQDKPFVQEYSVKYYTDKPDASLTGLACDRNGVIQLLSGAGLERPAGGQFLVPGQVRPDRSYRPMKDRKLTAVGMHEGQLVYLDDRAVLSNAWAGKLHAEHQLPGARLFAGAPDFTFLVSDGKALHLVQDKTIRWKGSLTNDQVVAIRYQPSAGQFWILGERSVQVLPLRNPALTTVYTGGPFTAFDLTDKGQKLVLGTTDGYLEFDPATRKPVGAVRRKLPATDITAVADVNGRLWFGTSQGAFALRPDGKYDYYNGERWLPGNAVTQITAGPAGSVLILTTAGLTRMESKRMTLYDKAKFYDTQVRSRHIRNGFNASLSGMEKGNIDTGFLADSDNDGLWTSMYLAGEIFRYAVTKDKEALQNCRESLDAMERLYTVTPVPGFPARSFERKGYIARLSDPERWQPSPQPGWDFKATTSSDEVIGHIFAFGAMAELMDDRNLKSRAITLIDTLMSHIITHDMYLIDYDGKPTMWGKWNPSYVNSFPTNVGDRKLNSSNIVAMLQTAYHFTKKEKYKQKAFELMNKHGYFENLMRPMSHIGKAPDNADEHSKLMSDGWNHSDDEMYFVGYWGLYRYAFNDTLRTHFKKSIIDHWEAERPEKEGAWNIFTALTGTKTFDLNEAAWYLREHPLDLIDWDIRNSHRKDIERIPDNFRRQTTKEVLPPDERPIQRHNGNMFSLDRTRSNGVSEHSAGDIWLLPYWMGRYLGVITAPIDGPVASR